MPRAHYRNNVLVKMCSSCAKLDEELGRDPEVYAVYPVTEFYHDKNTPDGYQYQCKHCSGQNARSYYHKNKDTPEFKARREARLAANRAQPRLPETITDIPGYMSPEEWGSKTTDLAKAIELLKEGKIDPTKLLEEHDDAR